VYLRAGLDGCENKNKVALTYISALVHWRDFDAKVTTVYGNKQDKVTEGECSRWMVHIMHTAINELT
jgi:hypothetical protein